MESKNLEYFMENVEPVRNGYVHTEMSETDKMRAELVATIGEDGVKDIEQESESPEYLMNQLMQSAPRKLKRAMTDPKEKFSAKLMQGFKKK